MAFRPARGQNEVVTFPIDLHIGDLAIPLHIVFDILAFGLGFAYYRYLRQRQGDAISAGVRMWIMIGAIFGALIGSRVVGVLEHADMLRNSPGLSVYFASKTIVGGLVGGLVGVELIKKLLGESRSSGDLFAYPLILAMIVGRVGCFLTGASDRTVGVASDLPWAFDQGSGYPQHPTALYEMVFLALLWVSLAMIQQTRIRRESPSRPGALFRQFMVAYLSFRLLVELLKPRQPLVLGLSAIQATCVLALLYYGWLWFRLRRTDASP